MADSKYALTTLIIHYDGAPGATTFTDTSPLAHTISRNGMVVSTIESVFGQSGFLDAVAGGGGSFLTVPQHVGFDFRTGDFTIDHSFLWDGTYDCLDLMGNFNAGLGTEGWYLRFSNSTGVLRWLGTGPSSTFEMIEATVTADNDFHRVRVCRAGDHLYLYFDGTLVADTAITTGFDFMAASDDLRIGRVASDPFPGYFDETRITKGFARSTGASYTLESEAFSDEGLTSSDEDVLGFVDEVGPKIVRADVEDVLGFVDELATHVVIDAADALGFVDTYSNLPHPSESIADFLAFVDELQTTVKFQNEDVLGLVESTAVRVVYDVEDVLGFVDEAVSIGTKVHDEEDFLGFVDLLDRVTIDRITDVLGLVDSTSNHARITIDSQDFLGFVESTGSGARVQGDSEDRLGLVDETSNQAHVIQDSQDRLLFADELLFDALCQAWVMNASTSAMSRYTGLPFNSVAEIDGRVFALGPAGIYELGADDDDGEIIEATAKSGKVMGAAGAKTHLGDIAVLMQSAQPVAVTVHSFDKRAGAYTYRTEGEHKANEPTAMRATPGKGLASVFYQFELANVSGARARIFSATVPTLPSISRKAY